MSPLHVVIMAVPLKQIRTSGLKTAVRLHGKFPPLQNNFKFPQL